MLSQSLEPDRLGRSTQDALLESSPVLTNIPPIAFVARLALPRSFPPLFSSRSNPAELTQPGDPVHIGEDCSRDYVVDILDPHVLPN